jgi:hypothetical protein
MIGYYKIETMFRGQDFDRSGCGRGLDGDMAQIFQHRGRPHADQDVVIHDENL